MILWIAVGLALGWYGAADEGKTQTVRLLDVLAIGPLMILAATSRLPAGLREILLVTGGATITFNLRNYKKEQ